MNIKTIKDLLSEKTSINEKGDLEFYLKYITDLSKDVYTSGEKKGQRKNTWIDFKSDDDLVNYYMLARKAGFEIDGKHISIQSTGLSFDYVAYKNKMLIAYPESIIDLQLVYEGDDISFSKDSGKIIYSHKINNPFANSKDKKIIGGYCVIKNKRGEFLTTLNSDELEKHRKVAKTDYIWQQWFSEMALKTVIKKAVKYHFDDIFTDIVEEDNKENDIEKPIDIELEWKQEIEAITTIEDLKKYWEENKGRGKSFAKMITDQKTLLTNKN